MDVHVVGGQSFCKAAWPTFYLPYSIITPACNVIHWVDRKENSSAAESTKEHTMYQCHVCDM